MTTWYHIVAPNCMHLSFRACTGHVPGSRSCSAASRRLVDRGSHHDAAGHELHQGASKARLVPHCHRKRRHRTARGNQHDHVSRSTTAYVSVNWTSILGGPGRYQRLGCNEEREKERSWVHSGQSVAKSHARCLFRISDHGVHLEFVWLVLKHQRCLICLFKPVPSAS